MSAPGYQQPTPTCPHCKHTLDPTTDILYRGLSFGSAMMIIYCGWCGAVLGGGPASSLHGSKGSRG